MKKHFTLGNILLCCAAVLGLVSILLMFAPAISYTVLKETYTYSGAQVAFGYSETSKIGNVTAQVFKFSAYVLPYLLSLAGIVFAVLAFLGKLGKISGFVAAGCFLVAGIFYFLAVAFCAPAVGNADMVAELKKAYTPGAGSIVSGILSIISAALCVVPAFLKK